MYVDNLVPFGRLLDTSIFSTTRKHGDMYEMLNNVPVWFTVLSKTYDKFLALFKAEESYKAWVCIAAFLKLRALIKKSGNFL